MAWPLPRLSSRCKSSFAVKIGSNFAFISSAPEYFNSSFITKIEANCNNWFLRASNLRKIYASLNDYYPEVMEKNIPESIQPDLDAIAKDYDSVQLGKLLQLILGCAINCENKKKHIEVMTTLSLEVKQSLKFAIDEIENIDQNNGAISEPTPSLIIANEEMGKLREQLNRASLEKEKTIERCMELEALVGKLKEEKHNLKIENDKLIVKLEAGPKAIISESNLRFDSIENESLFQRLNEKINQHQCELSKMEEQREDYKINLEIKEKEYHKLVMQNEQLQSKLAEYKRDRDELDRLKYLNEEFLKYKNITEVQKKKLEEFQELKKQIKVLEERNTLLVKQICELEEEKKSVAVYKGQLELIKKQRDELRSKMSEESFRADKAEDELKRLYKKYNDIQQDNEKKQFELERLKNEVVGMNKGDVLNVTSIDLDFSSNLALGTPTIAAPKGTVASNTAAASISSNAELNEKITRLEFENQKLKKSNDERQVLLQAQLDEERHRATRLEAENRSNSQKIIQLDGQLRELKTSGQQGNANGHMKLVVTLQNMLKEVQTENAHLKKELDGAHEQISNNEMRFKRHVTKAKETADMLLSQASSLKVSNSLPDTSRMTPADSDGNFWKNLVSQKDEEIEKLKLDYDTKLEFKEIEANLMAVNYHNLVSLVCLTCVQVDPLISSLQTFSLHRKGTEDRMANNCSNNSTFLSRQRQASSKKFVINSR